MLPREHTRIKLITFLLFSGLFGSSLNRVHAPSRSNLYKKRIALRRF